MCGKRFWHWRVRRVAQSLHYSAQDEYRIGFEPSNME